MSSVYHTEPPTKGKVVFQTSVGPIDVELWSKEAPKELANPKFNKINPSRDPWTQVREGG